MKMKKTAKTENKQTKTQQEKVLENIDYLKERMGEIVIVDKIEIPGIDKKDIGDILNELEKQGKITTLKEGYIQVNEETK